MPEKPQPAAPPPQTPLTPTPGTQMTPTSAQIDAALARFDAAMIELIDLCYEQERLDAAEINAAENAEEAASAERKVTAPRKSANQTPKEKPLL